MKKTRKNGWLRPLAAAILLVSMITGLLVMSGCVGENDDPASTSTGTATSAVTGETSAPAASKPSVPPVSSEPSEPSGSSDEPEVSDKPGTSIEPSDSSPADEPEPSESSASKPEESSSAPSAEPEPSESSVSEPEESTPSDPPHHEGDPVGTVRLTFDDGPSLLTPQVLDILKQYNVHATFFVVGAKAEGKIDLIKRAIDEGHQIAMHGNSHEYADIYKSVEAATENFFAENRKLQELLGIDPKIIRFPGGSSNQVSMKYCKGVMTNAAKILLENGYNYFDWDVSSGDAGSYLKSADGIYQSVINGVKPSKANVVLMHDGSGHEATVEALPRILEALINAGYTFEVITDQTPHVRHNIAN